MYNVTSPMHGHWLKPGCFIPSETEEIVIGNIGSVRMGKKLFGLDVAHIIICILTCLCFISNNVVESVDYISNHIFTYSLSIHKHYINLALSWNTNSLYIIVIIITWAAGVALPSFLLVVYVLLIWAIKIPYTMMLALMKLAITHYVL